MQRRRFLLLFVTELTARTGYLIGKSPVLPVLALSLGAGDALLGLIIAVSTSTGVVLKPVIGFLADRFGRHRFLLIALGFLVVPGFFYPLIDSPGQLVALRLLHGVATAVLGPVILGLLVAATDQARRAETFGWFGLARQAGNVAGPVLGGLLLVILSPANVYLVVALFGGLAIIPALLLGRLDAAGPAAPRRAVPVRSFRAGAMGLLAKPAILTAGLFEMSATMSLYFYKAFLPVLALRAGVPMLEVGLYLAAQELVNAALKPAAGRIADRIGHRVMLATGLFCVGLVSIAIPGMVAAGHFIPLALMLGASQALVQPVMQALIAGADLHQRSLAFGLVGAFRNAGKVLGPVVGGLVSVWQGPAAAFLGIGLFTLLIGAGIVGASLTSLTAPRRAVAPVGRKLRSD